MDNELIQMEELLQLFEKREQIIRYNTYKIFDKINTPVLETLIELFELPSNNIEWNDIQFIAGVLLLVCTITYNPYEPPPFVKKLFGIQPEDYNLTQVSKIVRIGVPITHAFKPKEEIKQFLNYIVDKNNTEYTEKNLVELSQNFKDNVSIKFDISTLTEEQLVQLKLHSSQGKGVKH